MHLTPEQIERQPFKMTRRSGYDIVQVRGFLREVAAEMRERQQVRERLLQNGDGNAAIEAQAKAALSEAKAEAAKIIADAEEIAGSAAALAAADDKAGRVLAAAQSEADALVDGAETRAEAKSAAVLAEAQVRLDALLAQERDLRRQIDRDAKAANARATAAQAEPMSITATGDARDRVPVAEQDAMLAEFMKSTLRDEQP